MSQEICGCSYVQEIQSCSYVLSTGPNSVDGTNPAPVEVVGAFSIIPRVLYIQVVSWIPSNSTSWVVHQFPEKNKIHGMILKHRPWVNQKKWFKKHRPS